MTLILTFGTPHLIVTAADSALTQRYVSNLGTYSRVLHGVQKLFAHPSLPCLISTWGDARLSPPAPQSESGADVPVQLWMEAFLRKQQAVPTVAALVKSLVAELNLCQPMRTWAGVDVAFFDPDDENRPAMLRVANGRTPEYLYGEFEVGRTVPLAYGTSLDQLRPYVAGDVNAAFWVEQFRVAVNNSLMRHQDADYQEGAWLVRYASLIVRSVAESRSVLDIGRSIGGSITTATLRPGRSRAQVDVTHLVSTRTDNAGVAAQT